MRSGGKYILFIYLDAGNRTHDLVLYAILIYHNNTLILYNKKQPSLNELIMIYSKCS